MDFFVGGYFIVKCNENDPPSYIPEKYYTVSDCISDIIPNTWAWDADFSKKERGQIKSRLSITDKQIDMIRDSTLYLLDNGSFQMPNLFPTVEVAKNYLNLYFSHLSNVKVIGIATTKKYVDEFLSEECKNGFGVYDNLLLHKKLGVEGKELGYELLGYEYWGFHTMYCHSNLINYCRNVLKVEFNKDGYISSYEGAEKAIECIRLEKVGAEPVLWQTWKVVEF